MGLNPSKGNMYDFITHTWNTVKGVCPHSCTYCYMKRRPQPALHFDERELNTDLGEGNFIFVGSSCDLFAAAIPGAWIYATLEKCARFDNSYLFQSKNPGYMDGWRFPHNSVFCTTLETNRIYPTIMHNAPRPEARVLGMGLLHHLPRYVTIEPIMDFDLEPLVELVKRCEPEQVNIGADSGGNHLPEPSAGQIEKLIEELGKFTRVKIKKNLKRITG